MSRSSYYYSMMVLSYINVELEISDYKSSRKKWGMSINNNSKYYLS